MEFLQDSIPMVSLATAAAALYARMSSSLLRPGIPRLVALLPLFPFMVVAPLAFTSSATVRVIAALFLSWLCSFKLALLAVGRGPLDPALAVHKFLFTALLPVKLKDGRGCAGAGAGAAKANPVPAFVSCAVEVSIIASILHLYQFSSRLHYYVRLSLYGVHLYCFMDLFFACIAAVARALGMETEPQFDKPYFASSLRDFWGRRWNRMVSAILRPAVYDPVRARAGKTAGVLTCFLVSGLMHEGIVYYHSLRRPDGGMTAFFLLHGVCCIAEGWIALLWAARGWPSLPRAVATLLVASFVVTTSMWLFAPPLVKDGLEQKMILNEWAAVGSFFLDAAKMLASYGQPAGN